MRLGHKTNSRGSMMAGNNSRKRPPGMLLLLLALGAALLCVVVLHKLRERRVLGLLLQERDRQLFTLQLVLQKERDKYKEMKRKLDDMKAKTIFLRSQRIDLTNKLMETEAAATHLKEKEREMETALEEKQNQINGFTGKEAESIKTNLQVAALADLLRQKETELEEMKHQLVILSPAEDRRAEDNIIDNRTALDNRKEDAPSQDGQTEKPTNSSEGTTTIEERQAGNSTEMAGNQQVQTGNSTEKAANEQEQIPRGQWVKFKTNIDDEGLKQENQKTFDQSVEVLGDQQQEKLVISQDGEQHGEGDEKGEESPPEAPKEENLQVAANSQYGNEQVIPTSQKETSKDENPKARVGHDNKVKTRRRRRRVVRRGREFVKHTAEHSESSQNDEIQRTKDENSDGKTVEADKLGTASSDGQSETPENPQAMESPVIEHAGDNFQDHEGDSFNEMAHEGQGNVVNSTERQSEMSEKTQDEVKNKSDDNKSDVTIDTNNDGIDKVERQDQGIIKETETANTMSNPEQTGAHSINEDHQSPIPGDKTETVISSNVGNTKDEDRELTEDAQDNKNDSKAEF